MNQHLISYAEHLEQCASRVDADLQYADRGFSAERSRVFAEQNALTNNAAQLRKAARTPEQVDADEQAHLRATEYQSHADERYQAELDRITAEAAFPLFEKLKLEGIASASFYEAKYHRHLPALESMLKELHKEVA